jgi:hypothetical protein
VVAIVSLNQKLACGTDSVENTPMAVCTIPNLGLAWLSKGITSETRRFLFAFEVVMKVVLCKTKSVDGVRVGTAGISPSNLECTFRNMESRLE